MFIIVEQLEPVRPGGHVKVVVGLWHTPPFKHGLDEEHTFIFVSQNRPVKPIYKICYIFIFLLINFGN